MLSREDSLALLLRGGVINIDMTEALRRNCGALVYAEEDAILIHMDNGYQYLLYAVSRAAAERAIRDVPEMPCGVSRGEEALFAVQEKYGHDYRSNCYQSVYLCKTRARGAEGWDIRLLDESYTDTVAEHYSLYYAPNEMREVLSRQNMLGAFVDGALAGFVGIHDDGSCGMLEVFPDYRRRGMGLALEAAITNLCLDRGWTPYGQVISGNTASLALQKQAGMTVSDAFVYWSMRQADRGE